MKTKTSKRSDELQNYLFIVRKNDLNLFTQKATQDQHESTMKLLKGIHTLKLFKYYKETGFKKLRFLKSVTSTQMYKIFTDS